MDWVLGGGAYEGQLFVNSLSDARLLRATLEAASTFRTRPRPTAEQMEGDLVAEGVVPLFDGAALERI